MSRRFENRVVFVTGAASGIGRESAEIFSREGARVACADISEEALEKSVTGIEAAGGEAIAMPLDVTNSSAVNACIQRCVDELGALDVLANVAGILRIEHADRITDEDWNRVLAVNLSGTFFSSRAAIPHLLTREGSSIVNVASLAGLLGQPYSAAYAASKAGVVNLTRGMAVEYAKRGLRVNCVCPGAVQTPLIADFELPDGADPELMGRLSLIPEMTTAAEVADAIAYLASPAARSISGVALPMDFGAHAA